MASLGLGEQIICWPQIHTKGKDGDDDGDDGGDDGNNDDGNVEMGTGQVASLGLGEQMLC